MLCKEHQAVRKDTRTLGDRMQTIVQAICTAGESLRDAIGSDAKIENYDLQVTKQQTPGRSPGWAKLHSSADPRKPGAINVEWNPSAAILTCRIVTRGTHKPSPIVGDLVAYLTARYSKRIRALTVIPTIRS
jgi:hypothetical protein